MDLLKWSTWFEHGNCSPVCIQAKLVDISLKWGKTWINWKSTGEIACIPHMGLGPCIQEEEVARFYGIPMMVIVQGLSIDGGDDGEGWIRLI